MDLGTETDMALPRPDAGAPDGGLSDAAALDAFTPEVPLPPANGSFDYQLGEAYPPPAGVVVVARDRNASVAAGLYNVCYVNGFQTQPDEADFWTGERADLLLRDDAGDPIIDPDWDEILLDVTTADKRARLADIVGGWIDGCADAGFDAVEID
ncbi:MAG: endo alpha-1,4 polygalactosaminidase, partial [Actinobacteria bacterium]|nr:endo alpha-1,4 polygalactosaminidase [Actinomycetota bacterium]NIS28779.1 endo alpha-1,4 polygalactosaminidase [Actinomycetota bacterium]NIW26032.1 hypothetical protein [Actinomycetota bacterium]